MAIFILIYCIVILMYYVFHTNSGGDFMRAERRYVIFTTLFLLFFVTFRSVETGTDTFSYIYAFEEMPSTVISAIFDKIGAGEIKGPAFSIVIKLLSFISSNTTFFLLVITAPYYLLLGWTVYRNSHNALYSFLIFISLGFYTFSLSGIRQTFAAAVLFLAFYFLQKKKLVWFVVVVVAASLFHQTAIAFLIAYPVARMKIGMKHVVATCGVLLAAYVFSNQIRDLLSVFFDEGTFYQAYIYSESNYSSWGFIIQAAIFVFCLFYKNALAEKSENTVLLFNLSFLGLSIQAFSVVIAEMFRVSMYFSIFNTLLLANTLSVIPQNKGRRIVTYIVMSVLIAYSFYSTFDNINYSFIWQ